MDTGAPDTARETRRRGLRRWLSLAAFLLCLAVLGFEAHRALSVPPALAAGPRIVEVAPHRGLLEVAHLLEAEGVIGSPTAFVALAVLRGTARALKAGEYEIPRGASLLTTLQLIERGKVRPHIIVMPEGSTVRDLARQLEAEGIATSADVLRAASDGVLARSLGIDASGLEGYLFPDTYYVTKGTRVEEILARMVQRFREKVPTPETLARARARDLTLHELVTLASIIEKEALVPDERRVIAGVFWNRLRRNMLLQADPTVAYAVGKDGAPSRQDLRVDHPFNTYLHRGLPPGPIANPGLAAVEAAVAPADVPYLYFVAVDDRTHYFSVTLEEHNEAVVRYRQHRRGLGGVL
jgi:UPF0755 protein